MTAVTVNEPYQVVHDGTVYTPGQTADVPDDVAARWIDAGWVTKTAQKRATKTAPSKRAR
jgi:hypothetical protein